MVSQLSSITLTNTQPTSGDDDSVSWVNELLNRTEELLLHVRMVKDGSPEWDAIILDICGSCLCNGEPGFEVGQGLRAVLPDVVDACASALECDGSIVIRVQGLQHWQWFSVRAIPLTGSTDECALRLEDVTEQHERENDLLEGKLRYRALADGLPLPVWVLKPDGQMQYVNRFFETFFGLDAASADFPWEVVLHPEDKPRFLRSLQAALEQQQVLEAQVRGRREDGQWRWLDVQAIPRHTSHGRYLGLAGSLRDITAARELEQTREQLLEAERAARIEAETHIRVKDEFLAMISHELRTPLTTVLGWGELLRERIGRKDPNARGMDVIVSSTQTLCKLIDDMLDLGGMLVGKVQLEMQPLDICEELQTAVEAMEARAAGENLQLTFEAPEAIGWVMADRTRLRQVFWNLLNNALKFSQQAQRREVNVILVLDAGCCHVTVRDYGVGITPDFLPHLFTRFRQAESTTTRRFGGMGLGLSIVQHLVELHGGTIKAASDGVEQGASFTLTLPLLEEAELFADETANERLLPQAFGTDSDALNGVVVLLVDDQVQILDYLSTALERHGAKVITLSDPREVLTLLGRDGRVPADVLLSDIGMPGMDGYTLARTIREEVRLDAQQLPMIAVTALSRPSDCKRALDSGFQAVIPKPCNLTELVDAIRRYRVVSAG